MTRRRHDPYDQARNRRRQQQHQATREQHRSSPCGGVPTKPATPVVFWGAVEKKTHLEFTIKARWTAPTEDTDGFPLDPSEYEAQAQAYLTDGTTPAETVTVSGNTKRATRKRKVQAPAEGDTVDWLMADFGKAVNPKKWKWSVRVRAANANGCYGEWSDWSTPELPSSADSEPKPPAPTFVSMDFQTTGGGKANKHRLAVTFTPVRNWDVPGGDTEDDLSKYVVRLEVQESGAGSWIKHASKIVADKDDGEANEDITVVFGRIRRGDKYRVKLRSIDRFNRRGDWGGPYPTSAGTNKDANADKPAAIASVAGESLGPRRVEFDWEDSTDAEFDRYRVVVQAATSSGGTYSTVKTVKGKQSRYRYVVPKADYDAGKLYYKATVYVQSEPDAAGNRVESTGTTSSVVSLVADEAGSGPTAAPSAPPKPDVRRRVLAIHAEWDYDPSDASEPVKHEVHISTSSGFTPSSSTRVGVTQGTSFLITKKSSTLAFTKADSATTYYVKIKAKNTYNGGSSATSSESAGVKIKKRLATTDASASGVDAEDADVESIIADKFQAGTSGDRIIIADPTDGNAVLKFVGGSGSTTTFTVGNAGNVTVAGTGGTVNHTGGLQINSNPVVSVATADRTNGQFLTWNGSKWLTGTPSVSIGTGAIGTTELADNAVTTAKIKDANVTSAKLATGAAEANISGLALTKLAQGGATDGQVMTWDNVNTKWKPANPPAAVVSDNSVYTAAIKDLAVTTAKIAASNVTGAKIADNTISGTKIVGGAIGQSELSANSVTYSKVAGVIQDGSSSAVGRDLFYSGSKLCWKTSGGTAYTFNVGVTTA